jgi:hypothetical protein
VAASRRNVGFEKAGFEAAGLICFDLSALGFGCGGTASNLCA